MRALAFIFLLFSTLSASAQERIESHCLAFAERPDQIPIQYASTQLAQDEVEITYVGHSMYHIRSFAGVTAVTDYNGGVRGPIDVVTMNHAHSSHYTDLIPSDVTHALRGWDPAGGIADHQLELKDMLVRNVTTDIRSEFTGAEPDGNSIFIFEVGGLCIGHLGHLHHIPTDEQFARIGRLDVVMAPVDGGMTLDLPSMIETLKRFRASVILPMHWRFPGSLERFIAGMEKEFVVMDAPTSLVMSLDLLPRRPTVMVMQPRQLPVFDLE